MVIKNIYKSSLKLVLIIGLFFTIINTSFASVLYDFEDGAVPTNFTYPANNVKDWEVLNYDNSMRLSNQLINDNEETIIQLLNIKTGAGNFSFDYLTSSEKNYDIFKFYIDDNLLIEQSGRNNNWEHFVFNVTKGEHTFKWVYSKDGSISKGDDRVYIDNVYYESWIDNSSTDTITETNELIINTTPQNITNITNGFEYTIELSRKGDCDLIVNNKKVYSFTGEQTGVYRELYKQETDITYYWYCEGIVDNKQVYEKSNKETFKVLIGSNNVNFYLFNDNNELLLGENFYLVTPCLKEFVGQYTDSVNTLHPHYIQYVDKGISSFKLDFPDNYEFCLVRGQINYKENDFSKNFNLVEVKKQIELGNLYIKNDTFTYAFKIDKQDLYNIYEPTFWDKTWSNLFNLVVSLIVGMFIIGLGLMIKSDKIVMGGIIIIVAGMGMSTINLIGGILF